MLRLHHWDWRLYFEPRYLWLGVYWKRYPRALEVYVCLVPMLPLWVYIQWHKESRPC